MTDQLEFTIPEDMTNQRLDKALAALCDDFSRGQVQDMISQGLVRVNHVTITSNKFKPSANDIISITPPEIQVGLMAQDIPIDVIFEDDHILVLNKPNGLTVHPGAGQKDGTLANALLHRYGPDFAKIGHIGENGDPLRPGIVHRLDKDTTGIMMVAKTQDAYDILTQMLADRDVSRIYHAIVWGVPHLIKGQVNRPIARHKNQRQKMVISNDGRQAITDYYMIDQFGDAACLLECSLHTGRTHQIRVHCEYMAHPVVGDLLYRIQDTKAKSYLTRQDVDDQIAQMIMSFPRQALHARELHFTHPITDEDMSFTADYPEDFKNLLSLFQGFNNVNMNQNSNS